MVNAQSKRKLIEAIQANWRAEMRGFCLYTQMAEHDPAPTARRTLRAVVYGKV